MSPTAPPIDEPVNDRTNAQPVTSGRIFLGPPDGDYPQRDRKTSRGTREYDCLFIGAGRVRQADGNPSKWLIPMQALIDAVPLFQGAASYLDHPALYGFGWHQSPSLSNLVGVCSDPEWSDKEDGIVGRLRLYDNDPNSPGAMLGALYDQILADKQAGKPIPEIGLSAIIWHRSHLDEETGLRITDRITMVDSVDHVYSAGARGYVRAALARAGWELDGSQSFYIPRNQVLRRKDLVSSRHGVADTPHSRGTRAPTQGGTTMSEESRTPGAEPQEEVATIAPHPREGTQPPNDRSTPGPDPVMHALTQITARLDRIESAQAHLADVTLSSVEGSTIEGMGSPPRAVVHQMTIGLDQITLAAEAMLQGTRPPGGIRPLSGIREMYTLLSGDYEMTGLYQPDQVYLANVTSTTMAQIVANVLNKRVMIAFSEYPKWWEKMVSIEDFASLQQVRWITLGGVGELPTVTEGAAYTELTWDDLAQRDSFVKKGGYLGLTIEAIDKDDTRRIQLAPRALAQAAWLTLSKSISAIFTANSGVGPNVYYDDSNQRALFHTSNSNLGTTALSAAAWESTRQLMRDQAEHNSSEPLGALTAPKYLLVPNELEFAAIQILATQQIPGSGNWNINPEAGGDTREARLSAARERVIVIDLWTDANNWAAMADPRLYPSIGLGFRFGRVPEVYSVADPRAGLMFSNDVMPVKVRYFYATGPVDYRGMYKHNVS